MKKIKEWFEAFRKNGLAFKLTVSLVLGTAISFGLFYVFLPPLNVQSVGFWFFLTVCAAAYMLPFYGWKIVQYVETQTYASGRRTKRRVRDVQFEKWTLIPIAIPVIVLVVGGIISSTLFQARSYAAIIEVKEENFATDMPESTEVTNIALMDTDSASVLGNRMLGSLSNMVSQYKVSTYYTQINFNRAPKKVSNLEYDGFFKWIGNRDNGIPGMVMVDPVKTYAEYVAFPSPMYYTESAFFGEDLTRRLRFDYPTKIFDSISFEVDDAGNPYYIVSCARPQVALFGASDITEVIIFDPTDGSSEIMPVADVPAWVDIVYTGNLATQKYNWHGTLSGGFLNSIIGNVGCKQSTDDFGYIVIDDDVWYFTGVTSVVSDDKSNIGFLLTNARTGEYKFYPVIGAEEHSAMAAAEGEVQEKGYVASFPSLVNIASQPTYIMVLKDAAGVVKLYALVNVENYSIVATGTTQAEAMSAYKKLLRQSDISIGGSDKSASITVETVRIAMVADVATVYITATDGAVYKGFLEADEALILIREGDRLSVQYTDGDIERIYTITSWDFEEEAAE